MIGRRPEFARFTRQHEAQRGDIEVAVFTAAMLRELDANLWKGSWLVLDFTRRKHFKEIEYHVAKLKAALAAGDSPERILEFCADIANHAMFLADSEGVLSVHVLDRRRREPAFVKPKLGVYWRLLWNPRWINKGWGGLRNPVVTEEHDPIAEPTPPPKYVPGGGTNIF